MTVDHFAKNSTGHDEEALMTTRWHCAAALAFAFAATAVSAQPYPTKPVRLVMPYPAGGSTDVVGRLVAERLGARLGETVIVDNRPGASAQIGTELAAKAPADGYTLLMATSTNAINHVLKAKLPYDFARDFQPVALVARAAQVLVVNPAVAARSVRELVALARSRPGKLTYASSGVGTSGHLAMVAFARQANIDLVHVPYKGNAPAMNDLLGGQVACGFQNIVSVLPHVKEGRLRALAVSTAKRSALAPDLPAMAELGYKDFDIAAWFGIMAPAGAPAPAIERLNREITAVLHDRAVQERLLGLGVEPATIDTTQAFAEFVRTDIARWRRLATQAGLTPAR
jgi:tripartite-type tricarboxylate transporter receptor subunit TctC